MAGAAAALAVVLALVPSGARAQIPVFELDEVIVPGKRPQVRGTSPASVSVITAAEMERLGARTVGDALAHLPEVTVLSYGSYGALNTLSIRGAGATQVLVLLDGMPVTGLLTGTVDLRTLPVEGVERIEVLRGPFSALHGSGALGGVVNIVSRTRVAPRLSGSYGSFDTAGAAVHYGTTDAAQRRGAGIIGRLDRSSGARPNSGLDSRHAALRLFDGALALRLRAYTAQVGVPGDAVCPTPSARQDDDRTILDLTWRPPDGRRSFTLYWRDERTAYTDPAGSTCFAFPSTSRTTGGVLGLQWQSLLAQRGGHVVVGGVEAEALRLTSTLSGVGERTATTGAIYLADEVTLGDRTLLSFGLRIDGDSRYGTQVNPRLGIVRMMSPRLLLRAALGRTYRGPTFADLYSAFGNPNLRPERAWSLDLGVSAQVAPATVLRATVFTTDGTNLIRTGAGFIPENIGQAQIVGGSLELEGRLAPRWRGMVNVSTQRARDGGTGLQLLRVPHLTAGAVVHYELGERAALSLVMRYVGERPDLDPATFARVTMAPYTVVGLRYTGALTNGLQFHVGLDNLMDGRYEPVAGYPAPGRNIWMTVTKPF